MQIFSSMQRNSSDSRSLAKDLLWLVPLVVYESLATIYYLLPPLFGFLIALLVVNNASRFLPLVLIYFLFFEADHSFFVFSSWVYLFLFFRVLLPVMQDYIICKRCILVLSVVLGYVGYFLFVSGIYMLVGATPLDWSVYLLLFYIVVESILVVFFL